MSFTDAEKTDIRRFCGYPVYGAANAPTFGYRYFNAYGTLEFKLANLQPGEETVVRAHLANLYILETALYGAGANLDTDSASVWKHNKSEVADRQGLYDICRRALCCDVLGMPPGPALGSGGGGSMRMVV